MVKWASLHLHQDEDCQHNAFEKQFLNLEVHYPIFQSPEKEPSPTQVATQSPPKAQQSLCRCLVSLHVGCEPDLPTTWESLSRWKTDAVGSI